MASSPQGKRFGSYVIKCEIARGGQGSVLDATHEQTSGRAVLVDFGMVKRDPERLGISLLDDLQGTWIAGRPLALLARDEALYGLGRAAEADVALQRYWGSVSNPARR